MRDVNVKSNISTTADNLSYAGILAAYNYGTIANVFTSGAIVSEASGSTDWSGGLVYENDGLIARSGSSATVRAGVAAGLVVNNAGTITESYTTGSVTADNVFGYAGGLVVTNYNSPGKLNSGTITQSFATGPVSSVSPWVGGVCGYYTCLAVGSDVYWNVQTTGQSSGGSNVPASNGLTTAQMSDPASFVGWDFDPNGAWVMPPGATHPVLRWQVTRQ